MPAQSRSARQHRPTASRREAYPRLRDRVVAPLDVLFVGINPGVRSATIGHHFAGYSNRFWPLLFDAGLVDERLRAEDDARLPEYGYGVTNLVPRCTPGIDTIAPAEYVDGLRVLRRKVRRWKPRVVAFVGITAFRILDAFDAKASGVRRPPSSPVPLGLQRGRTFEGAAVFVLPNPSGRNANYSYAEMQAAFVALRRYLNRIRRRS
jgi:TDG/mug DNA glycosylase family protein